jgi:anaerobic selenocysteine-containing dehydrogenase
LTGARREEWIGGQMRDVIGLRTRSQEAEAEFSPITAKKYDIEDGEMIGVQTPRGMIKIKAKVTPNMRPGVVSIPHGWAPANVNQLLDANVKDRVSGYITMRGNGCRLVKLG